MAAFIVDKSDGVQFIISPQVIVVLNSFSVMPFEMEMPAPVRIETRPL